MEPSAAACKAGLHVSQIHTSTTQAGHMLQSLQLPTTEDY